MNNKLKPCPLCGKEVKVDSMDVGGHSYYIIVCESCGCNTGPRPKEEACTEDWNNRNCDESIHSFLGFLNELIDTSNKSYDAASDLGAILNISDHISKYRQTKEILEGYMIYTMNKPK